MRKETLAAIIIGVFVGLLLGFGIWRANGALTKRNNTHEKTEPTNKPETLIPETPRELSLNIIQPDNLVVSTKELITVSATTIPGAITVISTDTEDLVLRSSDKGTIETELKLSGGLNQILLSAFDKDGKEVTGKLMIVYSTEFVEKTQGDPENPEKNLEERLKESKNKPKAYLGTITDKTDNSLQIKNYQGEIQIIAVDQNTGFVQGIGTPKKLKYVDIAIGDYILAMGYENAKGVLTTQRVIITKPTEPPTRKVVNGKVASINKKILTIESIGGLKWTLNLPAKWTGPDIKEITEGVNLFAVGEPDMEKPENLKVRTISLEPKVSATPTTSPTPTSKISPTAKVSPTVTPKVSPTPRTN